MRIPKPTEADKEYFRSIVPEAPNVEAKPMFGNVAAFVNGNMFMGLFGPAIGVRLSEQHRAELLESDGAGPFGPEDRPMNEYVSLPNSWRNKPVETDTWIARALEHTAMLPPKRRK